MRKFKGTPTEVFKGSNFFGRWNVEGVDSNGGDQTRKARIYLGEETSDWFEEWNNTPDVLGPGGGI